MAKRDVSSLRKNIAEHDEKRGVNVVREYSIKEFRKEFCKERGGFSVLAREIYLTDLEVGQTLVVTGAKTAIGLRDFMAEQMLYGFKNGSPHPRDEGPLSERKFIHEVNEEDLTYLIIRIK